MRSIVASSASPELVHWHDEKPAHLMNDAVNEIYESTRHALDGLKTFIVKEEHQIADIAREFGIHDFSHHLANKNLTGATISYSNGYLSIQRPEQKYPTSFPVQLVA